jgi:hypothetical protein
MREQTGVAAARKLAMIDHQRNLGAEIEARHLGAHAQRERRPARRAVMLGFFDASHDGYIVTGGRMPSGGAVHSGTIQRVVDAVK